MKRIFLIFLSVTFISIYAFAENESGMENKTIAEGVSVLAPKGSKMHQTNKTTYIMEGSDEYAARNFVSVDKRLDRLDKKIDELKDELKEMKLQLADKEKSVKKNAVNISKE